MSLSINDLAKLGDIAGIQRLLEQGVPVDFIDNGRFNETALQIAGRHGHLETVELLLAAGANVNHEDHDGFSPVTSAARPKQWAVVKKLIEHGADAHVKDGYGMSAADYLSRCRSQRVRGEIEEVLTRRDLEKP